MPVNRRYWVAIACVTLCACSADKVIEVQRAVSPDGNVVAIYRQYLYGGAAGGVGHCVSIVSLPDVQTADCLLLASRPSRLTLTWHGDVLRVHYAKASITKFRNEAYVNVKTVGPRNTRSSSFVKANSLEGRDSGRNVSSRRAENAR